jgi:hypothetical protein
MAGILGQSINVAQGLQGLAMNRMNMEQAQKEEQQKKLAFEALKRYQDTSATGAPDMSALNVAILNSPEMATKFQASTGLQDRITKQDAAQFAINAAKVLDNPDEFRRLAQERIARIQARGGNPEQTVGMLQAYEQGNKDQVKNGLTGVAASLVATGDLQPKAYELAFGPAPGSLTEDQKQKLELEKQKLGIMQNKSAQDNSYYTYTGTPSGLVRLDSRGGPPVLVTDPQGNSITKSADDPGLQSKLAEAKTSGKTISQAKANLPKVESASKFVLGHVDSILNHPGRPWSTGLLSLSPTVRGTRQADFRNRLAQIGGSSFLTAFETLKGGGQITEVEGQKATAAVNRMKDSTSDEEFNAAAKDFKDVVMSAQKNARDLASGKTLSTQDLPAQPASSKYKIEVMQ